MRATLNDLQRYTVAFDGKLFGINIDLLAVIPDLPRLTAIGGKMFIDWSCYWEGRIKRANLIQ